MIDRPSSENTSIHILSILGENREKKEDLRDSVKLLWCNIGYEWDPPGNESAASSSGSAVARSAG